MKLTMDEDLLRYNHYNLWNWLAKTGLNKSKAPMIKTLHSRRCGKVSQVLKCVKEWDCFACGSAYRSISNRYHWSNRNCKICPIEWGGVEDFLNTPCTAEKSLFAEWHQASDGEQRKFYASQIAKLPWRGKKP